MIYLVSLASLNQNNRYSQFRYNYLECCKTVGEEVLYEKGGGKNMTTNTLLFCTNPSNSFHVTSLSLPPEDSGMKWVYEQKFSKIGDLRNISFL